MTETPRPIVFARYPEPGRCKTRLIPALGADGAARLHRMLVERTLERLAELRPVVCYTGAEEAAFRAWLGDGIELRPQSGGDLGERMMAALDGGGLIVGSDIPDIDGPALSAAIAALEQHDLVIGPAHDGGFWLIGTKEAHPGLFDGVKWGTSSAAESVMRNARLLGLTLRAGRDACGSRHSGRSRRAARSVGRAMQLLRHHTHARRSGNELEAAIASLGQVAGFRQSATEIIVADGGSADGTRQRAEALGAKLVCSAPGRAVQQNAGAAAATGDILLFLHADTWLPPAALTLVQQALGDPDVAVGAFSLSLRSATPAERLIAAGANLRSRLFNLPYGDQALFMRRQTFEALGGFRELPVMEDYDLVRRARSLGRIVTLPQKVETSTRRWRHLGAPRTTLINQAMLAGWHLGIAPEHLARFYRSARR